MAYARPPRLMRVRRLTSRSALILACATLFSFSPSDGQALEHVRPLDFAPRVAARAPRPSMVDIGLPLEFRIRLDGAYARHASNRLWAETVSSLRAPRFGPAIRDSSAIEGRVMLTRSAWKGFEIGIAWTGRNRLSESGEVDFGRQFVGALFRFAP